MKTLDHSSQHQEPEKPTEDRLVLLCDGVFAIAITLLVLDIRLPEGLSNADALNKALSDVLLPRTITYLITFFVLALYWFRHRGMMKYIRHVNSVFIWLTLLFLAFVAFFPVTSSAVGLYGEYPQITILYTIVLSVTGYASILPWLYATNKRRLVDPDLSQDVVNYRVLSALIAPTFYLLSLFLIFFFPEHPFYIFYSWFLIGVTQWGIIRLYRHFYPLPKAR